ncbi:MAG: bifunctional allantoicase/(S)-ureidoglycine aminohydrolase [Shimia sp.]
MTDDDAQGSGVPSQAPTIGAPIAEAEPGPRATADLVTPHRAYTRTYHAPRGGLPNPKTRAHDRAHFTEAYAVIPRGVMSDIVASFLPGWRGARAWILARPLTGFAETFAQYIVELIPGGMSTTPEPDPEAEGVLFVLRGDLELELGGATHRLGPGGYVYLAPGADWALLNRAEDKSNVVWTRKRYEPVPGVAPPTSFVTHDDDVSPVGMHGYGQVWSTSRFVDPGDMAHDMHVNIVNFYPGGNIPFAETHVMEHGLYVLQGRGVYYLNGDWVEVEAGDYLWLRAFCPQACYAVGDEPFRYLLYKDVNRHPSLVLGGRS